MDDVAGKIWLSLPLPLPASTMIFMPVRGASKLVGCAAPFLIISH